VWRCVGQAVYLRGFVGKVYHGLSHAVVGCDTAATGTQQLKLRSHGTAAPSSSSLAASTGGQPDL